MWFFSLATLCLSQSKVELRIGELEEVEEKHQREIHHLYEELRHERARATRLEAENAQHKQDAQDYLARLNKETARANRLESSFQERLQQHQLEHARKMQAMAKLAKEAEATRNRHPKNESSEDSSRTREASDADGGKDNQSGSTPLNAVGTNGSTSTAESRRPGDGKDRKQGKSVSPETSAESELFSLLLKEKTDALREAEERFKMEQEKWLQQLKEKDNKVREARMNDQVEKDKMALTIKELKDADSQSELRLAQFKARFSVQDERITDMEQQLSSLYTAFGLIKEEQDAEDMKRAALECNLNEADEEIARQVDGVERKQSQRNPMSSGSVNGGTPDPWAGTTPVNSGRSEATAGVPRTIRTSATEISTPGMMSPTATAQMVETPPMPVIAQPFDPSPQRTPGTWELLFPDPGSTNTRSFPSPASTSQNGLLIKGVLLVKSKSVMRKWKSRFCRLYLVRNHYQWDLEGKSYTLGTGISKVEFYPNHPLSFSVYTNPFDDMAPVVHAAASNEEDYHRWMSALTMATTGRDSDVASLEGGGRRSIAATRPSLQSYQQYSRTGSVMSGLSAEEQEAVDLERALNMSQAMT
jgi:hypothetical protein